MRQTTCLRCDESFEPTKDNKLIGLVGTADAYMCNDCLAIEAIPVDFADDRGVASDALRIAE